MSHSINFLHRVEPLPQRRDSDRRRVVHIGVLSLCALVVVWIVLVLIAAGQVVAASLDGRDALMRARDAAVALDFEQAGTELADANDRFGAAERGFVLLNTVRFLPWVSDQVKAADALLTSGREMIQALESVVELGGELVRLTGFSQEQIREMRQGIVPSATFDDLSPETKRAILERLSAAAPDLEYLSARIAIVRSELSAVEMSGAAGPVASALAPVDAQLAVAQEAIHTLSIAAGLLPEFAGLGEQSAHLLLFLNNTELRPGGGFIGTFGVLKTLDGDVVELETRDSYVFDNFAETSVVEPVPEPLARYNAASKWFFRDANWSPDFRESAVNAVRLFNQETNALAPEARAALGISPEPFDGVLGVTPSFLRSLMEISGPLTVGGQTFTAENVTDRLEYQVEVGYEGQGIPESQRKEVIADLVNAIKACVYSLPLSEWPRLVAALEVAFSEKQLVLMSFDPATETLLSRVGWAGVVSPGEGDAQMFVDASLASLKTDPKVSRSVRYEIFKNTSGQYVGRTTVRYAHTGAFDWKTTRYRTYARLYVPAGSELIGVDGSMLNDKLSNASGAAAPTDVTNELGMTSFGTFISIEPGESRTLTFEYALADSVVEDIRNGSYSLSYLKQVGAQNNELTLDLDFDKNVTDASIPEDSGEWGDDVYRLNTKIDQDLQFEVEM